MKRASQLACLLALSACRDPLGTWPGELEEWRSAADADGDGFDSSDLGGDDCDDQDASVNPAANEVCNGLDDDCDGDIDEDEALDVQTWYHDGDGDNYGDATSTDVDCEQPSGYVADATDCDDGDDTVNPGAAESWYDGIDQDCDGWSDYDQDGDGYDSEDFDGWDCDDLDASTHPGVTSELDGFEMAYLCPGAFTMGSQWDEVGRDSDETQREVTLTRGFYIGVHEVTQAEFEGLMDYQDFEHDDCPDCPAENLNWHEAAALTNTLSVHAGLPECYACTGSEDSVSCSPDGSYASPYDCPGYRLPTEAEWEYAARAGTTSAFSNGGNLPSGDEADCDGSLQLDNGDYLDDIAWYCGNGSSQTEEVGTRQPNPWGLYDMYGNVYEWCHDWYDEDGDDGDDPHGPSTGSSRTRRGGAFYHYPENLRSANRNRDIPSYSSEFQGFRLVRSE